MYIPEHTGGQLGKMLLQSANVWSINTKVLSSDKETSIAGAAHLPGMVASITPLPVIGVPIKSKNSTDGWDSILSILQMPGGVPVATVALNGAKNAGILALQILGTSNPELQKK